MGGSSKSMILPFNMPPVAKSGMLGMLSGAGGGAFTGVPYFQLLTRKSLTSAGASITTSAFTTKDNLMVLFHGIPETSSHTVSARYQLGTGGSIDTGSDYAQTGQRNSAGTASGGSRDNVSLSLDPASSSGKNEWAILNINNISSEVKMTFSNCATAEEANTNGVERGVVSGKYVEKSAQVNIVKIFNSESGSHNYSTDSELIVLGFNSDKLDDGNNFWEHIETKTLTSANTTFESTQIATPKNYYYIQASFDQVSSSGVGLMYAGIGGSYSGSAGANRYNYNFGTDGSQDSVGYGIVSNSGGGRVYINAFIVNKAGYEKYALINGSLQTGGSGTIPDNCEAVAKWTTKTGQLDIFKFTNADGNNLDNGTMTIWGAD